MYLKKLLYGILISLSLTTDLSADENAHVKIKVKNQSTDYYTELFQAFEGDNIFKGIEYIRSIADLPEWVFPAMRVNILIQEGQIPEASHLLTQLKANIREEEKSTQNEF